MECRKFGPTDITVSALRWVSSKPAVSVDLVGTLNARELEENWGVLDWALSGENSHHWLKSSLTPTPGNRTMLTN